MPPFDVAASFVTLATGVPAARYEPSAARDRSRIAFVLMHPDGSFISHLGCRALAERGHRVLGVNSRFANVPGPTGGPYIYHEVIFDAAAGVAYLRDIGAEVVVLCGHSGGGPLFSAYQNLAEHGAGAFQGGHLLTEGPDSLGGLPAADALVLLDGHLGYGAQALLTLDASIIDEERPSLRDPSLDMFGADNGYDPDGAHYGEDFVARYCAGQAARMDRLVDRARSRLAVIESGGGEYPDDEPMIVPGIGTRLWSADTSLLAHTAGEWPLVRAGGTVTTGVVSSLRRPSGRPIDQRGFGGALVTSVRKFLATHAVRPLPGYGYSTSSLTGIDWHSSYTSAPANLEGVTVPLLSLVMSGHYFLVPGEVNFTHAASTDKELAFVEGATHMMAPLTAAEPTPGAFGDTRATTFDYVDAWARARF